MNVGQLPFQEQVQKLSAVQLQFLQLLTLDNSALQQMMEAEFLENPLLEMEPRRNSAAGCRQSVELVRDRPQEEQSLEKYLISQLNFRLYSKKEHSVLRFLIANLDDNGFFSMPEEEAAALTRTTQDTIHRLLTNLKELEPPGIFARDLRECLLIQLYRDGTPNPLLKRLISDYLEELGRGDIRSVAKELALPPAQIRQALAEIGKLNPRPLNGLDTARIDYVIPDLLLQYDPQSGQFQAALNDEWYADYHVSAYYLQMAMKTDDPQLREYFAQKQLRAKLLVDGILRRRETLLAVCGYVARKQTDYLLGRGQKISVTMTEAAQALELSVSTVSRAVKDKYVQCPFGCIPFKALFDAPALRKTDAPSRDTIKQAMKSLIREENPVEPLSDASIAEELAKQGIQISRRTVAKYRDSLGIPGAAGRKLE